MYIIIIIIDLDANIFLIYATIIIIDLKRHYVCYSSIYELIQRNSEVKQL